MTGGYRKGTRPTGTRRRPCAYRLTTGLLGGLLFSSLPVPDLLAEESVIETVAAVTEDCSPQPAEKSIVIQSGKSPGAYEDVALATDQSSDELEPIANVSEYEPDLAEGALVPTLADPPGSASAAATPAESTPSANVSIDDEADMHVATDGAPAVDLQAASFNGVTPGVTTRAEVLSQWSNPAEPDVGGETLTYTLDGFPTVAIAFNGDIVHSVRVELGKPAKPQGLITKLGLAEFRPVVINDSSGELLSTTFPERGVTFSHQPTATIASDDAASRTLDERVYEIEVRPIEAASFIDRAGRCAVLQYTHRIADLETALKLDPNHAEAMCRLAELKLAAGQAASAEKLAAKAVEMAADNHEYRLQWSRCLKELARYDRAVEEVRAVLEGESVAPVVRAAALEQMGSLAELGSKDVQERALPLHNKAIELADGLAASDDPAESTAANRVLLDAHLSIAERIAAGDWQNKHEVVGQWIGRASAIAEQMIVTGQGDVSLRLQVAISALTAGGRLQPPVNPTLWIEEAEQAASEYEGLIEGDQHARNLMNWRLGLAYCYAAEIQHRRGDADLAIRYGELADATLSPLADNRAEMPDTRYALGRLYFQIGAVHAVHQHDHELACDWYDRAAPLLMEPVPFTTIASPSQHGDALVSMGVSYWEAGQRDRAYELTEAGVQLVEQGIAEGLVAEESLAVPQGNLTAMGRALGKIATPAAESTEPRTQVAKKSRSNSRSQTRMAGRTANDDSRRR